MSEEQPPWPEGAEVLPGVTDLYEAYERTKAAAAEVKANAKRSDDLSEHPALLEFAAAQQALSDAREHWRGIREVVAARAFDEWAKANPEAAAAVAAEREARLAAEAAEEQAVTPEPVASTLGVQS